MTKLTEQHRQEIILKIEQKKMQLGTYGSVGTFCQVSESTINLMSKNKYQAQGDDMWIEVGTKLGWTPDSRKAWITVETKDAKNITRILTDAKNNSLFLPISDLAGIGKSTGLKTFAETNKSQSVYFISCKDWGKKDYLIQLCRALGIDTGRGFKTPNDLLDLVIDFFKQRSLYRPLLIVDEADKLKASALRLHIPLYNECEDMLGVVIAGTENLEKEIKRGVQYQAKGYDEIDSRFGRRYIKLIGARQSDVLAICEANGIADAEMAKAFFNECCPVRKKIMEGKQERIIPVITDLRRLKRLVQKEHLKATNN